MIYLFDLGLGEILVGATDFEDALSDLEARDALPDIVEEGSSRLMLMGLSGEDSFFFRASALKFVQEADTLAVPGDHIEMLPLLTEGKLQGEVRRTGIVVVDPALDLTRPFEVVLDFRPRGGVAASRYVLSPPEPEITESEPALVASGTPPADAVAADPSANAANSSDEEIGPPEANRPPDPDAPEPNEARAGTETPTDTVTATAVTDGTSATDPAPRTTEPNDPPGTDVGSNPARSLDFDALLSETGEDAEESALTRLLARTSWIRVAGFVLLLALTAGAFALKRAPLRWVTLMATLFVLGFYDGGFLSVSHITAGISVGPAVYAGDLPLLLFVSFTVVTTLLWGRVFCGFLCPFGALQDVLERIVPSRLRRELPQAVHDRALWVKYGILALVLAPPLLGSGLSLFQYFEPFGTVFYLSSSVLLWSIAGVILLASAIVPRFYCRYACPLGAALGLASLLSPFRIRRVEQCTLCKVCEQRCPTGAIRGPEIDFKECVRCNACEIQLIEKNGVCAHDMERIRPRLVRLPVAGAPETHPFGG